MSMKKSNDTIGNRTRDLSACTAVPQPTALPRAQDIKCMIENIQDDFFCTLVQVQRFCTGRTAHRGSRGIALLFHDHGTRRGWGVSVTPRPLFTPGKDPVPVVQETEWAPGPNWTGAENLAPTGFDPRIVLSVAQSLYRLSYPAHAMSNTLHRNTHQNVFPKAPKITQ